MMKTKFCYLLALLLILPGCKDLSVFEQEETAYVEFFNTREAPVIADSTIGVMTYNIQLGFPGDLDPWNDAHLGGTPDHLDSLAFVIDSVGADIVLLQEVARDFPNALVRDQALYLADKLDMNVARGFRLRTATFNNTLLRGELHNAILSRYPIRTAKNHLLLYSSRYTRSTCLDVSLELPDGNFLQVLNTHFRSGGSPEEYAIQSMGIANIVADYDTQVVFGGDFNANPGTSQLTELPQDYPYICFSQAQLCDRVLLKGTFKNSGNIIDHLYLHRESPFRIEKVDLMAAEHWFLSDHLGVLMEMKRK